MAQRVRVPAAEGSKKKTDGTQRSTTDKAPASKVKRPSIGLPAKAEEGFSRFAGHLQERLGTRISIAALLVKLEEDAGLIRPEDSSATKSLVALRENKICVYDEMKKLGAEKQSATKTAKGEQ